MRIYKLLSFALALFVFWPFMACVAFVGCQNSPQRNTYNSIAALELAASTALDQYDSAVIKGTVSTNSIPQVTLRFNQFQAAAALAASIDQAGTNAVAPASLNAELVDLTSLIQTLVPTK